MIQRILQWLGGDDNPPAEQPTSQALDLFMDGTGVAETAAILNPGIGGVRLLECQQAVEDEIRAYIEQLEAELDAR